MASLLFSALPLALAFIMFSLGLGLTLLDFRRVLTFPKAIIAGVIAQTMLVPISALAVVWLTSPPPEIAVGIMILSFCPGGVASNIMAKMAGGSVALSISLTGITSLLSILTIPIFVTLAAQHFMGDGAISTNTTELGLKMFTLTAAPVLLGITLRHFFTSITIRLEPYVSGLAALLFAIIAIASIVVNWDFFQQNFWKLGPPLMALNLALLMIGALMGMMFGLLNQDRVTLSIETGVQNSALGITIGALIMASETGIPSLSLPSGIYSVTVYFVTLPAIALFRYLLKRQQLIARL